MWRKFMDEILVKSYTEDGYRPIPSIHTSDEEYTRGLQCFVPTCTDIVPIDREKKIIYLVRRKIKPMKGLWWIGGKMNPDDTKEMSVVRSFKREAGLELPADRFKLAAFFDYRWKDREQLPQDVGCHMTAYTFTIELSDEEIALVNLDETFEKGVGLTPFTREKIEQEIAKGEAISAILDLYDYIFPVD